MKRAFVRRILPIAGAVMLLMLAVPVFVMDQFRIKGVSMNPTLMEGNHVLVNKLLMGARIYRNYDFSRHSLSSFRMPGLRNAGIGDVLVFNYPDPYGTGKIEFRINYVYVKRCIGRPGDTVGIKNGYFYNLSLEEGAVIGEERYQRALSSRADSLLAGNVNIAYEAVRMYDGTIWTIKEFGPLYVPAEGHTVRITAANLKLYEKIIELETGVRPVLCGSACVMLGNRQLIDYTFRGNYYFLCGDNVFNSDDSRYFGLVPEDYIVGIATRIICSDRRGKLQPGGRAQPGEASVADDGGAAGEGVGDGPVEGLSFEGGPAAAVGDVGL